MLERQPLSTFLKLTCIDTAEAKLPSVVGKSMQSMV